MRLSAIALKRRQWEPFAFATPALVLIAVVIVFPLIYSFYLSLRDFDLSVGPDSTFVGARNYGEALLRDDRFEAVARYEPGRAHGLLSGDFYDVVQTADGTVHAVIGDVSGHGAAEAALGVCLRVAWRTAVLCGTDQLEQIGLLEEILVAERSDPHVFATVTSLVFPPDGSRVRVVRAGHPGLLLRRGTGVSWVEPEGGMALGLLPGTGQWTASDLPLDPDSRVVLFTDGLFEGRDGPGSRLGEEGLLSMAGRCGELAARAYIDALVAGATEGASPYGGLADDVAVLHLGWRRPAP